MSWPTYTAAAAAKFLARVPGLGAERTVVVSVAPDYFPQPMNYP